MRGGEWWLFLFAAGVLGVNCPFLTIFERIHGPVLFILWVLFIGAMAVLATRYSKDRNP